MMKKSKKKQLPQNSKKREKKCKTEERYLRRTNLRHSFSVRLVGSHNCFLRFLSLFCGIII